MYSSILAQGEAASYTLGADRAGWLQVAKGEVLLNEIKLTAGDSVAITHQRRQRHC